jgi:hypothetical protein
MRTRRWCRMVIRCGRAGGGGAGHWRTAKGEESEAERGADTAHSKTIREELKDEGTRLLGHPSVLPDRKTHNLAELVCCRETVIVTPCALREAFSSYASVSAEQKLNPTRSLACQRQRGFFVGARTCVVQAYIHNIHPLGGMVRARRPENG